MNSLNRIEEKNILVIGDVMLDTYYQGDVSRISPEAPVPIFQKKKCLSKGPLRMSVMYISKQRATKKIREQRVPGIWQIL